MDLEHFLRSCQYRHLVDNYNHIEVTHAVKYGTTYALWLLKQKQWISNILVLEPQISSWCWHVKHTVHSAASTFSVRTHTFTQNRMSQQHIDFLVRAKLIIPYLVYERRSTATEVYEQNQGESFNELCCSFTKTILFN